MVCKGKTAIVTGASGKGMGRSIAMTLAREGANIVINYLSNEARAIETVQFIKNHGGNAEAIQGNVFSKEDCGKLADSAISSFGRIDICIIGPGAGWNPEGLLKLNPQAAIKDVSQELAPVYNLLPLVLCDMEKRKWGRIIGIASNMTIPSPSYSYNAAKSARIEALKLAVGSAWEIGVTVNVIAPGPVNEIAGIEQAYGYCMHKSGWHERKGITPQDIAESAAFLCSDSARYITGCVLPYMF